MARITPDWVRDGIVYEINTRNFSTTGDFRGITARLDELKKLGVTILWLMPIHPNGELKKKGTLGSPYAVRDYYGIHPSFGTAEDFRSLVAETHARRMRILIDVVANHTAWDSVMMAQPELYKQDAHGRIVSPVDDWPDVAGLDYTNPKTRTYMTEMMVHWLRDFDLDGFRCDVAGMVQTDWWNETRDALDRVKRDYVMLAEWHSPDLLEKAFDLDYSWPLHKRLTEVLTRGVPASALRQEWEIECRTYPQGALHLRFSDNHDERRAIARFGERGALAASAFMFLLGVPLLYNGMEVGDTTESGAPALFEHLPIFWEIAERRPEFPRFYSEIIPLRRDHEALRRGELEWVENSDPQRIVTFLRRSAKEALLIAVNFSNQPWYGSVQNVAQPAIGELLLTGLSAAPETAQFPKLSMEAWGVRVFQMGI